MTNLIYIGRKFYMASGTMMSSIYHENGSRYDWGFVQRDLDQGEEINIRQGTRKEIENAENMLSNINNS